MSLPQNAPYLDYYTYYTSKLGITVDFIVWDRYGLDCKFYPNNYHVFKKYSPNSRCGLRKFLDMIQFGNFACNIIAKYGYDRIIVFTIQCALFIKRLLKKYEGRYVIDIRDYSPTLKIPTFKHIFHRLVKKSFATVISSPGFKSFLPSDKCYIICHNIHPRNLLQTNDITQIGAKKIKVLTIGMLRDKDSNIQVIHSLKNKSHFQMEFAGKGIASSYLQRVVMEENIWNATFFGEYKKEEESEIVNRNDVINAYMPDNFNSKILLSNRLYLCVLYGKPLIANKNSIQGKIVEKYNLGITINSAISLDIKIEQYMSSLDVNRFNAGRRKFIANITSDYNDFDKMLSKFITL